jgi:hypothetical protein
VFQTVARSAATSSASGTAVAASPRIGSSVLVSSTGRTGLTADELVELGRRRTASGSDVTRARRNIEGDIQSLTSTLSKEEGFLREHMAQSRRDDLRREQEAREWRSVEAQREAAREERRERAEALREERREQQSMAMMALMARIVGGTTSVVQSAVVTPASAIMTATDDNH